MLAFLLGALVQRPIDYTVEPLLTDQLLKVTLKWTAPQANPTFQMPEWGPGHYVLEKYAKNVRSITASAADGNALVTSVVDDHTWQVESAAGETISLTYTVTTQVADGAWHFGGPSTYIYPVGQTQTPAQVQFKVPADWSIAIGLKGRGNLYPAPTYDVLADNPVTLGKFIIERYAVRGVNHEIALRGKDADKVDRAALIKACKFISEMETDYFRGAPYDKYVWHFSVFSSPDGAGGLEHLSSTEISLASGLGPSAVGVLAHEFFHLWNVKRIRSRVLGPFDYTQLPKTGALWWLEGVDDYFAHSLLRRYNWTDDAGYFGTIAKNYDRYAGKPARLEVAPYEASFRVRDAANGRGNSDGYKVSYYDTGFVLGACLDLAIIDASNGKNSLDDIEHELFRQCRNSRPGFEEPEIRKQLVRFGGDVAGQFYDTYVVKATDIPINTYLGLAGLELKDAEVLTPSLGVTASPSAEKHGVVVLDKARGADVGLFPEDAVILAIGTHKFDQATNADIRREYNAALRQLKVGEGVEVTALMPGSSTPTVTTVKAVSVRSKVRTLVSVAQPSERQLAIRKMWLAKSRR